MPLFTDSRSIRRDDQAVLATTNPGLILRVRERHVSEARDEEDISEDRNCKSRKTFTCSRVVFETHCTAGARCAPPSNFGGRMVKLALEALPSCWIAVPVVPGVLDTANGSVSCQHSSVEWPLEAEIAVRLRNIGVARARATKSWSKLNS